MGSFPLSALFNYCATGLLTLPARAELRELSNIKDSIRRAEILEANGKVTDALQIYEGLLLQIDEILKAPLIAPRNHDDKVEATRLQSDVAKAIDRLKAKIEESQRNVTEAAIRMAVFYTTRFLTHPEFGISRSLAFGVLGISADLAETVLTLAQTIARVLEGKVDDPAIVNGLRQFGIEKKGGGFTGQLLDEAGKNQLEQEIREAHAKQQRTAEEKISGERAPTQEAAEQASRQNIERSPEAELVKITKRVAKGAETDFHPISGWAWSDFLSAVHRFSYVIGSEEEVPGKVRDFLKLNARSGIYASQLFQNSLPALERTFGRPWIASHWDDLMRFSEADGEDTRSVFEHSLPWLHRTLGLEWINAHWDELGQAAKYPPVWRWLGITLPQEYAELHENYNLLERKDGLTQEKMTQLSQDYRTAWAHPADNRIRRKLLQKMQDFLAPKQGDVKSRVSPVKEARTVTVDDLRKYFLAFLEFLWVINKYWPTWGLFKAGRTDPPLETLMLRYLIAVAHSPNDPDLRRDAWNAIFDARKNLAAMDVKKVPPKNTESLPTFRKYGPVDIDSNGGWSNIVKTYEEYGSHAEVRQGAPQWAIPATQARQPEADHPARAEMRLVETDDDNSRATSRTGSPVGRSEIRSSLYRAEVREETELGVRLKKPGSELDPRGVTWRIDDNLTSFQKSSPAEDQGNVVGADKHRPETQRLGGISGIEDSRFDLSQRGIHAGKFSGDDSAQGNVRELLRTQAGGQRRGDYRIGRPRIDDRKMVLAPTGRFAKLNPSPKPVKEKPAAMRFSVDVESLADLKRDPHRRRREFPIPRRGGEFGIDSLSDGPSQGLVSTAVLPPKFSDSQTRPTDPGNVSQGLRNGQTPSHTPSGSALEKGLSQLASFYDSRFFDGTKTIPQDVLPVKKLEGPIFPAGRRSEVRESRNQEWQGINDAVFSSDRGEIGQGLPAQLSQWQRIQSALSQLPPLAPGTLAVSGVSSQPHSNTAKVNIQMTNRRIGEIKAELEAELKKIGPTARKIWRNISELEDDIANLENLRELALKSDRIDRDLAAHLTRFIRHKRLPVETLKGRTALEKSEALISYLRNKIKDLNDQLLDQMNRYLKSGARAEMREGERLPAHQTPVTSEKKPEIDAARSEMRTKGGNVSPGRRKSVDPESVSRSFKEHGYFETLLRFDLTPRAYFNLMIGFTARDPVNRSEDYFSLTYDEVKFLIEHPRERKPYGVLTSRQTAINFVHAVLDTIPGFKEARERNDIKTMAELYRAHVINYVTVDKDKNPKGGQTGFFFEAGGLKGLMGTRRPHLTKTSSPASLLRLALPDLIDANNPGALNPLEVDGSYWLDPENARYHIIQVLDTLPGFKEARERNDIKTMAELYRKHVIGYKSSDQGKYSKGGQYSFFYEAGGLKVLFGERRNYVDKNTVANFLKFALPEIVDDHNPGALRSHEVEDGHWEDPSYARDVIMRILDTLPGFKEARERNDIKTMAELYRKHVIGYRGGQLAFFRMKEGLGRSAGGLTYYHSYLDRTNSAASLVQFALPEVVDDDNPYALHSDEIGKSPPPRGKEKKRARSTSGAEMRPVKPEDESVPPVGQIERTDGLGRAEPHGLFRAEMRAPASEDAVVKQNQKEEKRKAITNFLESYYVRLSNGFLGGKNLNFNGLRKELAALGIDVDALSQKRKFFSQYLGLEEIGQEEAYYVTEVLNRDVLIPAGFLVVEVPTDTAKNEGNPLGMFLSYGRILEARILNMRLGDGHVLQVPAYRLDALRASTIISGIHYPNRIVVFESAIQGKIARLSAWNELNIESLKAHGVSLNAQMLKQISNELGFAGAYMKAFYEKVRPDLKPNRLDKLRDQIALEYYLHEGSHALHWYLAGLPLDTFEALEAEEIGWGEFGKDEDVQGVDSFLEMEAAALFGGKKGKLASEYSTAKAQGEKHQVILKAGEVLAFLSQLANSPNTFDVITHQFSGALAGEVEVRFETPQRTHDSHISAAEFILTYLREVWFSGSPTQAQTSNAEIASRLLLMPESKQRELARELASREFKINILDLSIQPNSGELLALRLLDESEIPAAFPDTYADEALKRVKALLPAELFKRSGIDRNLRLAVRSLQKNERLHTAQSVTVAFQKNGINLAKGLPAQIAGEMNQLNRSEMRHPTATNLRALTGLAADLGDALQNYLAPAEADGEEHPALRELSYIWYAGIELLNGRLDYNSFAQAVGMSGIYQQRNVLESLTSAPDGPFVELAEKVNDLFALLDSLPSPTARAEMRASDLSTDDVIAIGSPAYEDLPDVDYKVQKVDEVRLFIEKMEREGRGLIDLSKHFPNKAVGLLRNIASKMGYFQVGHGLFAKSQKSVRVVVLGEIHTRSRYQEIIEAIRKRSITHVGLELPGSTQDEIDYYLEGKIGEDSLRPINLGRDHEAILKSAKEAGVSVIALEADDETLRRWIDENPALRKTGDPIVVAVGLSPKRDEYAANRILSILQRDPSASFIVLRGQLHLEGLLTRLNSKKGQTSARAEMRSTTGKENFRDSNWVSVQVESFGKRLNEAAPEELESLLKEIGVFENTLFSSWNKPRPPKVEGFLERLSDYRSQGNRRLAEPSVPEEIQEALDSISERAVFLPQADARYWKEIVGTDTELHIVELAQHFSREGFELLRHRILPLVLQDPASWIFILGEEEGAEGKAYLEEQYQKQATARPIDAEFAFPYAIAQHLNVPVSNPVFGTFSRRVVEEVERRGLVDLTTAFQASLFVMQENYRRLGRDFTTEEAEGWADALGVRWGIQKKVLRDAYGEGVEMERQNPGTLLRLRDAITPVLNDVSGQLTAEALENIKWPAERNQKILVVAHQVHVRGIVNALRNLVSARAGATNTSAPSPPTPQWRAEMRSTPVALSAPPSPRIGERGAEVRDLAENTGKAFAAYATGKIKVDDARLVKFSEAVYLGANENIDEFLKNFIRTIEDEAGVDADQYVQDIITTMRGIAQFVSKNYEKGGTFVVSPGDLSDEEQAAYYGKAAAEASALIEKLYYHGTLGPNAQRALKKAGVENLQSVKNLNAVSTIAFRHNFMPVLLSKTDRLQGNFRNTLLQIGIDYSNYEVNDLSQFEIALAAFVQFVAGYAAINKLDASEVQILNRKQAGEEIDEETLKGIEGKLLSELNQIPGISNVITGFMNGAPNILISQIQNFVTQYRSDQRTKVAA